MKKTIGVLAGIILILVLCVGFAAFAENNGEITVAGIGEGQEFLTGNEIAFTTTYTAENTDGVKLVRRVFTYNGYYETVFYEKESSGNQAEDSFCLWEDQQYILEVSAVCGEETQAKKEIHFGLYYNEYDDNMQPNIPEYIYTEGPSTCSFILDYTDRTVPEEADVQLDKDYVMYRKDTGKHPGDTITFDAAPGNTISVRVTSHKKEYYSRISYNTIKIVCGKLEGPQAEVQDSLQAGEPLSVNITSVPEEATELTIRVVKLEGGSELYQCETWSSAETGEVTLAKYGLDAGEYRMKIQSRAHKYEPSEPLMIDFEVTGERAAAPKVTAPSGKFKEGDTAYFTIQADGMTAAEEYIEYNGGDSLYQAENGIALIPQKVYYWQTSVRFIALVDGRWSEETDYYDLKGEERENPGSLAPVITVEEESTQGKDLWVKVESTEKGKNFTYSLGRIMRYSESGEPIYDKIIYDKEFDISDGGVLIQGCNLMEPGTYGVSINVYAENGYSWLNSAKKEIKIKAGAADLPAAPTAELLTTDSLCYDMTKIKVNTGGGADKIYAFIKMQNSYDIDTNPVEISISPEDTSYTFEHFNFWGEKYTARFSVSRNGIWSAVSEPVSWTPRNIGESYEEKWINLRVPEEEMVLGDKVTVTWDPLEDIQWYRFNIKDELLPATVTSWTIDTAKYGYPGRNNLEIYAYLPGHEYFYQREELILLDPKLRISAKVIRQEGNQVTLQLSGVAANRVRVRVNGKDKGLYGIKADQGTATLTVSVSSMSDWIQVANYDTDECHWGTWSIPVNGQVTGDKLLELPEELTRIEANAFEGTDCEIVIIPDSCTYIGSGAFKDCKKLVYVSYKSTTTIEPDAFEGCSENINFTAR